MKSTMCAERRFWKEFINLYKKCPALWDIKNEQYKNKESKDKCYNVLVKKMKTIDPNADQSTVRKKINIFRTNFRREVNRVSSINTNSTLWYFEDMMFTLGNDDMRNDAEISTCTSETDTKHEMKTFNAIGEFDGVENIENTAKEIKKDIRESVKKKKVIETYTNSRKKRLNAVKREYWTNFIKLYQSFPALWKTNSQEYKDRKLKEECYEILVNKLRQIEPDADRAMVRKKINTLRCNFRREQNRIRRKKCASKLWYYNNMEFINNQDIPSNETGEPTCESEEELDIKPEIVCDENSISQNEIVTNHMEHFEYKTEVETISDHLMAMNTMNTFDKASEDEIDLQGKIWAAEFRKLIPEQQLFAKKAIDDILFERRLAGIVQSQNK